VPVVPRWQWVFLGPGVLVRALYFPEGEGVLDLHFHGERVEDLEDGLGDAVRGAFLYPLQPLYFCLPPSCLIADVRTLPLFAMVSATAIRFLMWNSCNFCSLTLYSCGSSSMREVLWEGLGEGLLAICVGACVRGSASGR
jgi:hypothetical protein